MWGPLIGNGDCGLSNFQKEKKRIVFFCKEILYISPPPRQEEGLNPPPCTPSHNFTDYAIKLSVLKTRLDDTTNQGLALYMFKQVCKNLNTQRN